MKNPASGRTHTLRKRNLPVLAVIAVLGMAMWCSNAIAQSGAGSIQGTVVDPTGAVVPGASIHVVNQANGTLADSKSNDIGFYLIPDLFTGTYAVTVSAPGMKIYATTIELLVDQHAVVNPVMTPGAVTQQVTVNSDSIQLTDTTNGTISSTLENQRINQLPMNTRELLTLAFESTPGFDNQGQAGQRANGLLPEALEYVADGVPLTNRNFGGENNSTQATLPDPDAIQEVRFELTDTPAQYATPATAIISTKSGTNSLHGALFETAVNSYFGVAKNRNNLSNFAEPPYVRNEFGASAGGPVVFPHIYHGKDKTFWFLAYERYSLAATSVEQVAVPTVAMRGGDFSGLVNGAGQLYQLYDPNSTAPNAACPVAFNTTGATENNAYCRNPFPTSTSGAPNQIPIGRLNPSTKLLYAITPLPTNSNDPLVQGNLTAPNVSYVVVPTVTWRLDHEFNENNKTYLRYTQNNQLNRSLRNYPNASAATVAAGGFPAGASGYQIIPVTQFGTALGYTHVFSPTFFAETVLSQQWFRQYVGGGGNPNLNYESMLGLPNNFGETGFPVLSGLNTMSYGGTMYQYQENQIISQLDENLTKTIRKHQLQFGGRFRHERLYYLNSRNADTTQFGNGQTTGLEEPSTGATYGAYSFTGYSDADFFLGGADSYSVQLEPPPSWFRDMEFDAYFQDNFHVSRNLTLNLGLRYEAHPAKDTQGGVDDSFDLKNHAIVTGAPISKLISEGLTTQAIITNMQNIGVLFETPSQAGYPNALYENADLTVSPRVGFAWQPLGNGRGTVLRGAYGRYIYPIPTRNANPGPTGLPFAYGYTQSFAAANQSPNGLPNYNLLAPQSSATPWTPTSGGSPIMGVNSANVVNSSTITAITPGIGNNYFDPDYKPDMVTEVNTTLEQPLKGNSALRFSWVWTHGSYLDHYYYPNSHPSNFVWEMITGIAPPNGGASVIGTPQQNTYAATALGPYDNTVYGNFGWDEKTGWSNDNEFQVNYQRLFHHGFAYQIFYVWSRAFRVGGNTARDSQIYPTQNYLGVLPVTATLSSPYPVTPAALPPRRPSGIASYAEWHALDVFEQYKLDSAVPPQHIQFNYIFDLPFGRGKKFLGNSSRILDELVGGYQIAGTGYMLSQIFQPASSNWGPTSHIHVYKHKLPITDCRSGTCYPEYLWFNGYIAPTVNGNVDCAAKCVYGLPANYTPYEEPIDTVPGTTNYNTNNVTVVSPGLSGGSATQSYSSGSAGVNRYSQTFIQGPKNWETDISLFKVFPITERYNLRFNMDAFNFLNHQGFNNPNSADGTEDYLAGGQSGASSYNTPRQVQFTLRFTF